jgi:hypothetical protein
MEFAGEFGGESIELELSVSPTVLFAQFFMLQF